MGNKPDQPGRLLPMSTALLSLCLSLFVGTFVSVSAQSVIRLYEGKAPGSETWTGNEVVKMDRQLGDSVVYNIVTPTLTAFLPGPAVATGTAMLIFPGGGLTRLFIGDEGAAVARLLTARGIAAFVVNYRLALLPTPAGADQLPDSVRRDSARVLPLAIADGRTALALLRRHAVELGIRPDRVGVLGFGTGGLISLSLVYEADSASRPTFLALAYPQVGAFTVMNVPTDAPPLFIISATAPDRRITLQSADLYRHWLVAGRPVELHSYTGSAGVPEQNVPVNEWVGRLTDWLSATGYLSRQAGMGTPRPGRPGAAATSPASPTTAVASPGRERSGHERSVSVAGQPQQKLPAPTSLPAQGSPSPAVIVWTEPATASQNRSFRVSGTVRDSATGRPLAGAVVVVDYRKRLTGTTTNERGAYAIDLSPGQHILAVRLIGYTPVRKEIRLNGDAVTVDVNLISVASQLEEVVVTTKGFDQTIRQPILGVNQLNVNMLKKLPSALGEVDLLRGLQMLPGVTSVGEASNGVNIRGGTTDQNLILLDETPIFNPTHMFGLFSVFPADVLSTVDLYKGNVPARFGGRAASVLDVTLRNPSLDKFSLSGGVSVVSNKLTADMPIVKGKFGLLVAGRGAFNDFLLPLVSDKLANIRAKFGDGVVKAFWRINDRNTLTVTGYASKDLFRTDLLANLPNVNGTATRYDHQTVNVMGRWFRTLSPRLTLQTTGLFVQYVPKILSPELSGNDVTLRSSVMQRQVKSNLNYQFTNQKLEVGLSATNYRIEPGTLLPGRSESVHYVATPTENALELGAYVDYERSIGPRLAVSAGLRYSGFASLGPSLVRHYAAGETRDNFSVTDYIRYTSGQVTQTYGGPEPRLGIRYTLTPNSSLKVGYNLMRQYLQVVTNTTTPLPTSRWKTSDPNIRPQVSQLLTAGYFLSFKNNIYELSLESYWRATQHVIDYRPGADFLLQPYPETQLLQGRSNAYGIETMISKKKGELTGWLNYTYARTLNQVYEGPAVEQNVNGGNWYRANYDRPHTVNASLTIDVDRHNSFGLTFAYSTGRPYSSPTGFVAIDGIQYPYYGIRNNQRLPDYHRLDFTWNIYNPGMHNRRWEGRWAFTVYNLYGRKNAYSIFFKSENGKTNAYQLQIFAAPIISLAYNFVFK